MLGIERGSARSVADEAVGDIQNGVMVDQLWVLPVELLGVLGEGEGRNQEVFLQFLHVNDKN